MENKRFRDYIYASFSNAPQTKQAVELKEEIIQNLNDKYFDLMNQGKSEEAAYNIAISSIGDLSELIASLQQGTAQGEKIPNEQMEKEKKQSALILSAAIMMYILCVVPVLIFENVFGIIAMFVLIAAATGMLIYNNAVKPKSFGNESVVEEFKQFQAQNSDKFALYKSLSSAVTAIGVVLYFVISFTTGAWYITWVIFLIIPAVRQILKALFQIV